MREKKAELDTIRQEIERLTENKDAFAQEVTYNEHLIGTYQSKINTCFAVISQNLAQTPTLSKVHSYLQKDQEYLTGLASEVYQQANSLLDQHNRDCASENYAITSYLEADASQLTAAITAPNEEIAALQSEVSAIRFVASGLYEKEIDESKRQSVELKIQADLLALQDKPEVQGQTPSKELKKLAFLPMPNNVRETDPEYHGKLKSAYRMLSEVRHSAIDYRANYHTFYRTYYGADEKKHPSVLLKRLGLAVDANGRLIHQQTTDFRTSAHNIEAGLDNADSLLAETKPMQLTFERITEEYVSFCNHRGPRVQRLVEETKVNQDRTFDIKNDIVALESAIPEFYALIDELTSIASSIRVEAQRSASEVVMSQHTEAQAQLYRLAEAGDEAAMNELQMQQGEYGRSSFSRVELPPEHEEIVEQRKKAINDLEQAYKKLARDIIELEGADTIATLVIKDERLATELDRELQMRLSKRTAGLIPEEVKLREMLEATRLELRTEVDRYNGFAQASRPAIDEALETISDELSNSLKWFQTQGVQITIDKQALRETLTANSPVTPDAATTDWRPVVPAMNERKLLTKKLSTFLGKVSTRMMHLKIKGR